MQLTHSTFSKYHLTTKEELAGQTLTNEQRCVIQNQLCTLAESHTALVPNAESYPTFIQQEAFIKGQMTALQYLLDCADVAQAAIANPIQE